MRKKGFTSLEIHRRIRKRKFLTGFSLIELLVVVLIFSSIFIAMLGILNVGKRSWSLGTTQAEIQQEARRAMSMITKELREASAIDSATFVSGISTGIIRFTLEGQTIEYTLNGTDLEKTVSSVTTSVARDVDGVQFKLLGSDIVHIALSTKRTSALTSDLQFNLNAHIKLRN